MKFVFTLLFIRSLIHSFYSRLFNSRTKCPWWRTRKIIGLRRTLTTQLNLVWLLILTLVCGYRRRPLCTAQNRRLPITMTNVFANALSHFHVDQRRSMIDKSIKLATCKHIMILIKSCPCHIATIHVSVYAASPSLWTGALYACVTQ